MYVYTMTHDEIIREYERDYEKVIRRASYEITGFRSAFLRKHKRLYPYSRVYEYTTLDTHNRYLYVLSANSKRELLDPIVYVYAFYTNKKGMTGLLGVVEHDITGKEFCIFYSRHFFERFGERALGITDVSWQDIANVFIRTEHRAPIMENNGQLSNAPERYKPDEEADQVAFWFEDGVVFANLYSRFIEWTTYVSKDMLGDNQLDEVKRQLGDTAA